MKKWLFSDIIFYLYVVLMFYFIPREQNYPYTHQLISWVTILQLRKIIPYVCATVLVTLLTEELLSMKKKHGLLFCIFHIVICLVLLHLEQVKIYGELSFHFPLAVASPYFFILLSALITNLFLTVLIHAKELVRR